MAGVLQAVIEAIGEELNELNGVYHTKLTADVVAGATTFPVETTYDWPASGRVTVNGITYRYASKTNTSLDSITYLQGGTSYNGTKADHPERAIVTESSRSTSAVDQIRRATQVDYAEGEDLNVIGRNLGVPRAPLVGSDDLYREIIKAIAYNPRGTMYGLELALTALVGAGNFQIIENLETDKNKIIIELSGDIQITDSSAGKTYMTPELQLLAASASTVSVPYDPSGVGGVQIAPDDLVTDCRTAKPSAHIIYEYDGDPGVNAWVFRGANEATQVTVVTADGGATEINTNIQAFYTRAVRVHNSLDNHESNMIMGAVMAVLALSNEGATSGGDQASIYLGDGDLLAGIGSYYVDGSTYNVGLTNLTGVFVGNVQALLNLGQYYYLEVRKVRDICFELYIDGAYIDSIPYSSGSALAQAGVIFGQAKISPSTAPQMRFKDVHCYTRALTDLWAFHRSTGSTATANPTQFNAGTAAFAVGDVGKRLEIKSYAATNGQGGNARGIYWIDSYVSNTTVTLVGANGTDAITDTSNPTRITLPENVFTYPDDLGKKITISGSTLGNDGTYTITNLFEPGTLTDFSTYDTANVERCATCEVSGATFVTELNLEWAITPAFVTDTSLDYTISDKGTVSGGTTLNLSTPIPNFDITIFGPTISTQDVVRPLITYVPSAHVYESTVGNVLLSDSPPVYSHYPFYLNDPVGYVEYYIDDLTAAGVIPEYSLV